MVRRVFTATVQFLFFTLAISCFAVTQQPSQPNKDECSVPTYTGKDLDKHPTILAKPEPDYSKEDRRKYAQGVTTLRAALCGSGEVLNIKIVQGLSEHVDQKTIAAARKIQFIPGEKNGAKVSRPVILKYFVTR